MTYEEIRAQLAELYGWTFEVIDGMSFEQIGSALRGGRPPKGLAVHSAEQVMDIARNWRKHLGI